MSGGPARTGAADARGEQVFERLNQDVGVHRLGKVFAEAGGQSARARERPGPRTPSARR